MQIDWWTLALQAMNALVLVWLLQRFLFRPVAGIIAARREAAERLIDEAKAKRDAAEAALAKASGEAEAQAAGRAKALHVAEAEAAERKAKLIAEARDEAGRILDAARTEVAREREAEAGETDRKAAALAVDIAARLFARLPPEAQIDGFVDGLAEGLAAMPADARDAIAGSGGKLHIRAPRALTPEEEAACRAALEIALGGQVGIEVEVEPAVIAGLEAEGPLGSVRNSFRADLERIAAALASDDRAPT